MPVVSVGKSKVLIRPDFVFEVKILFSWGKSVQNKYIVIKNTIKIDLIIGHNRQIRLSVRLTRVKKKDYEFNFLTCLTWLHAI